MRPRRYLSTLATAALLASTLTASAQGPANPADTTATIPGTSLPADSGPIIESDVTDNSTPAEITTGSATSFSLKNGKANQAATTDSVTPAPSAGPTTSGPAGNSR